MKKVRYIDLRGRQYPVAVTGQGPACFIFGNGVQVEKTLSDHFKSHFTVYATDHYFCKEHELENSSEITMEQLLDDIHKSIKQLGLVRPLLVGHSAYGIVALAYAAQYPETVNSVLMVGSPFNCNDDVATQNNQIFQQHADPHRKAVDARLRTQAESINLDSMSVDDQLLYILSVRERARYWHDPETKMCEKVWDGVTLGNTMSAFFAQQLAQYDVTTVLGAVWIPVLLAAGASDFDSCPVQGWTTRDDLPLNMQVAIFNQSGHWPQCEEPEHFDQTVLEWFEKNKKTG